MNYWKLLLVCCAAAFAFSLPAGAGASDVIVVVQKGQSLRAIAAQHKVSVEQICQWNKLSAPDKIKVGQKIYVRDPELGTAASSAPVAAAAPAVPAPTPSPAKSSLQAKTPAPKPATAPSPAAAPGVTEAVASGGVPEKVKQDLDKVGKTLVNNAAKNILPNIKSKAVAPGSDGGFVASYVEVDASDVRTEAVPSAESGKYVGSIRYAENQYECPGKSKADALKAECHMVKSRRMCEMIQYEKGKWNY